ncbi:MAG: hypothetical protein WC461_01380 [Candidatus Paceibacterota bacterium]
MWIERFIARIQNSEERTKRRWLILCSVAAMMVIAALWVILTVSAFQAPSMETSVVATDEPGFWQILKNGTSVIFNSATKNFKNVFSRLTEKKTIVIE